MPVIGVYSTNTKDEEVIRARSEVSRIVLSHEYVKQIHGFYLVKEKKAMRFDIVISFEAKDRKAVYNDVVAEVSKAFPGYELQIAMDTDYSES